MTANPYANMSIATSTVDSDGENVIFTFVFGHECSHEAFEARLKETVERWMRSEDAAEYAESNYPVSLDWIEVLGQIPEEFLTDMGIARLDHEAGYVVLDPDEDLIPADVADKFQELFIYGPEGEAGFNALAERDG
jgi:hypothetical protein